jgi:hypothetical protein
LEINLPSVAAVETSQKEKSKAVETIANQAKKDQSSSQEAENPILTIFSLLIDSIYKRYTLEFEETSILENPKAKKRNSKLRNLQVRKSIILSHHLKHQTTCTY